MKLKISMIICCVFAAMSMSAQEVDKATVQAQATAAQDAGAALKGVDTGEKAWKFSGSLGLNAAATGLWNWAAGGNNNVNGVVYGRFRLLYHENNIAWDTNLDMEYGLSWIDQKFDALQKSSDKLNFTTKFGWEFEKTWYLTALAGFQTQFAYGRNYTGDGSYDPMISKFLAPAYTDISVGIDWKPNDIFSVYISPVAGRFTHVVVSDKTCDKELRAIYRDANPDASEEVIQSYLKAHKDVETAEWGAYGLDLDLKEKYGVWSYDKTTNLQSYKKNTRSELGLSIKGAIDYSYKNLKIQTALSLFTPYAWDKTKMYEVYDKADPTDPTGMTNLTDEQLAAYEAANIGVNYLGYRDNNRRFGNFDVDWTVNLGYQFFNCLQVTLSTDLRYYNGVLIADKEGVSKERVQFKGIIGLGIGYTF